MLLVKLCSVALLLTCLPQAEAAKCDGDHQFEFKFRPIKIHPVKRDDYTNSKARCGPDLEAEKLCDLMVTVGGSLGHCHIGNGFQMMAPKDRNFVEGGFTPPVHNYEAWTHGTNEPFTIEVCDDDSGFRFRNDHLFTIKHDDLRRGCHRHKFNDRHADHPWVFDYELCCKPLGARDDDYDDGREGGRRREGGGRDRFDNEERGERRDHQHPDHRNRERDDWRERGREHHQHGHRNRERHEDRYDDEDDYYFLF